MELCPYLSPAFDAVGSMCILERYSWPVSLRIYIIM